MVAYVLEMPAALEVLFRRSSGLREKEATSLWKYLRRILSLLLQMLLMGTLLFAALALSRFG